MLWKQSVEVEAFLILTADVVLLNIQVHSTYTMYILVYILYTCILIYCVYYIGVLSPYM